MSNGVNRYEVELFCANGWKADSKPTVTFCCNGRKAESSVIECPFSALFRRSIMPTANDNHRYWRVALKFTSDNIEAINGLCEGA